MSDSSLAVKGTLGLSVAMGIGRFFYTPLLPIMMVALNWSDSVASWIAAANYLGYLLGSVALSRNWLSATTALYRGSMVISTLLLAAMAMTDNSAVHIFLRLIAGAASAAIFVCVTQFVNQNVHTPSHVGVVYGGVGLGITVSGLVAWLLGHSMSWSQLWLVAAAISAIFTAVAWQWPVNRKTATSPSTTVSPDARTAEDLSRAFRLLDAGYFFQGFGYIIIGTYLVVLAGPDFGSAAAAITWVVAGIAAVPSPYLWSSLAERFGRRRALLSCYVLQVIGAVAAIFRTSTVLLIVAAILFGATFMGVTMLTISTGVAHGISGGSARLTSWYSLGQVAGPAIIGLVFADSITASFIVAAIAIAVGLLTVQLSRL